MAITRAWNNDGTRYRWRLAILGGGGWGARRGLNSVRSSESEQGRAAGRSVWSGSCGSRHKRTDCRAHQQLNSAHNLNIDAKYESKEANQRRYACEETYCRQQHSHERWARRNTYYMCLAVFSFISLLISPLCFSSSLLTVLVCISLGNEAIDLEAAKFVKARK